MRRPLKWTIPCLLCLLITTAVPGQQMIFADTPFDSNAAIQARAILNNLPDTAYQKKIYHQGQTSLPYRLLAPPNQVPHKKYPLVITLHNSSRIGNDNEKQLEPLARIWLQKTIRERYPAFVVAPQFALRSSNYLMDTAKGVFTAFASADVGLVLNLVKTLLKEYRGIDRRRLYIVGYSMGASTAQHLLSSDPDLFAAMVSIAGVPDFSNISGIIRKPIWLIHGDADDENPYPGSMVLFNLLKKNRRLLFTTFRQFNHNTIPVPFLSGEALPAWLFKQKR
ncbi:prolyl oligopeptidase family serine peptidase [Niabella pedocola]|uniref:Prolyl oligopeptidase family serine peptidase n=1 Tax=Niabella pedocola TaxID=1752077 RepID=A0ABS8PP88_9BACT|nr:prolyl oligopeptidase family serine peptidase [Niabella pedocola]MCD2422925.1 prolyl oligopeptidase family serine peptidase [Niabella pedocola]